ncbi:hypothetical protein D8B26_004128 [Coccidioides posadasii str. Silveira]|uniref:DUF7357 domain-containing protein n=1 Tax=Coccidioides posadasii (strain RMSCC 757 / Silveira) TaxID=443226 RepID=E9DHM5_COCPS|nr:conserved hypothetical protein [Coccidioides posadasii str. Silveira]QVM09467.1 hypothetical protein D8B26_004128 [Coccidioides posadasii str. Silveira]
MRLHLVIHRHDFPATRVLWSTPFRSPGLSNQPSAASSFTAAGSQALNAGRRLSASTSFNTALTSLSTAGGYTISQLLADINEVVPLETQPSRSGYRKDEGQWGLEDYVVELMGSECLHFMEVDNLLRDGDELVIRPLHYEELEVRQIGGRHQIATDGTHLIDGVAFGKRPLKRGAPSRPPIKIPPRNKRRRINEAEWVSDRSVTRCLGVSPSPPRLEEGWCVHRSLSPAPAEVGPRADANGQRSQELSETGDKTDTQGIERPPLTSDSAVVINAVDKFDHDAMVSGGDTKDSSKQAGNRIWTVVKEEKSILSSSSSDSSESESGMSSSSEESSEEVGDSSSDLSSSVSSTSASSSVSSSISSDDTSSVSESDVSVIEVQKPPAKPEALTSEIIARPNMNPPGMGSRRTKHSNLRTKLRKRLAKMKAAGILPQDANFDDLRAWDQTGVRRSVPKPLECTAETDKVMSPTKAEFEKRRAQLLRDIEAGGVDVSPNSAQRDPKAVQPSSSVDATATPVSEDRLPNKKAKLDLASTRRLLFGSLGLRTPKTKSDAERLKAQLAETLKKPGPTAKEEQIKEPTESTRKSQALMPVENWQDFIILKATECIYEDVKVPPPPFPFVQRWDAESQKQIRERRNRGNGQNKKRKRKSLVYEEEGNQYDGPESYLNTEITLNCSDKEDNVQGVSPAVVETTEKYNVQERSGLVEEDLVEASPTEAEEDLPLFGNVSSLPNATETDFKPGAIIAFKQLEVSKATNWQPVVSDYRTAVVERILDDACVRLRLAKRDREERPQNQDTGPREYSGFEMPGYDEDQGEDDGLRDMEVCQLMEAKLLQHAPAEDGEAENLGEVIVEDTQANVLPDRIPVSVLQEPEEMEIVQVSSQTRRDISQLIDDAGFRSGIDSDLTFPHKLLPHADSTKAVEEEDKGVSKLQGDEDYAIESPTFSGFEKTPVRETSERPDPGAALRPITGSTGTGNNTAISESPLVQTSSMKNAAQEVDPVASALSIPSEDGLRYITDLDDTGPGGHIIGESQNIRSKSPVHSDAPDSQDEEKPLGTSQPESLLSIVPSSVQDDTKNDRPGSSASSMVTNPFYEVDRVLFGEISDGTALDAMISSTAPPRITEPSEPKRSARVRRPVLSSPRQRSPEPLFVYGDDDRDGDYQPDISEQSSSKERSRSSQIVKEEPMSSQAPKCQLQIPEGSQLVDLTLSSDPVSPGNSDGDFAKSQGLPSSVQYRRRRPRRANSSMKRNGSLERRVKTRRSAI